MRLPPLLLALCAGLAACGGGGDPLVVGLEAKYPPFESLDPATGEPVGFDVDLARALGEHLGRPVEFRDLAFDALIPELQSGRLDLVCSAVSWSEERAQVVAFSAPYARVPMGVLLSVRNAPGVSSPDELDAPDVTLAVQGGTSGEQKARARFPRARIAEFKSEIDAAHEVAQGGAHALVYDMVSIVKHHRKWPDRTRILDADLGIETYCMAMRKGSPILPRVDEFLALSSGPGGRLETLLARWDLDPDRFAVRPGR